MAKRKNWQPVIGAVAQYVGGNSVLSRRGHTVRVLAEASGQRMVCEVIGRKGVPVLVTVKATNLGPLALGLFD